MTSATLPLLRRSSRPDDHTTMPWWMVAGGVAMVLSCIPAFWPWKTERELDIVVGSCFVLRISLHALAFWWASQRAGLPARLRQVLQVIAGTSAISVLVTLVELVDSFGHDFISPAASTAWLLASSVLTAGALLWYPRARERRLSMALVVDTLITMGGYTTLMVVQVTLPSLAGMDHTARWTVIAPAITHVLMLIGVNAMIVRGAMIPSRRAFWCMVAGLATFLPVQVFNQLEYANAIRYGLSAALYFLSSLPELAAAWYIRTDPLPATPVVRHPRWLADLNPLPLTAPVALGLFVLLAVQRNDVREVRIFGTALVAVSLLLVVRVLLSGAENARLVAADTERTLEKEREKTEAIGRLAGGIAHEFNNAMTVVMGCAELGQKEADDPAAVREDFTMIHEAAGRVVSLTTRLLAFSGRQAMVRRPINLQAAVLQKLPAIRAALPAGITLVADHVEPVGELPVDAHQFSFMCRQLLDNAIEAMPDGGSLVLALRLQHMPQPIATLTHVLPAGWYATYVVRDSGIGIPAELQRKVFDPFFSTRKMHEASGLGLAAVQGIIAAHDGGIVIDSAPGRGTAVTIYLPATPPA